MTDKLSTPERSEAIGILESVCAAYVNWYNNGRSMDAGDMAYAMVSDVRQALARLKKETPQSESAPIAPMKDRAELAKAIAKGKVTISDGLMDYTLSDHAKTVLVEALTDRGAPLGWVTMTDKRVSDPVYRSREDAEKDAELLRARGIETKVAGVYL